jgi:hypothetical protein
MDTDDKVNELLKKSINEAQKKQLKKGNAKTIEKIFDILVKFIKDNKFICYGGTAINNILPVKSQFYDYDTELPDYDFFSPDALNSAKQLADLYYNNGFISVEAKAGVHEGTFKVYVNYMAIADITNVPKRIFNELSKDAIIKKGIKYAPPDYLKMAAYLELSRPMGDVSRWEKVFKRLTLLNYHYPFKINDCKINSLIYNFRRSKQLTTSFNLIKDELVKKKCVFFGGFAISKYFELDENFKVKDSKIPYIDALSSDSETTIFKIKEILEKNNIKNVKIFKHNNIGEILSEHYELKINDDTILILYNPLGCHSYNTIKVNRKNVRIASVETIFSLYLAFLYVNSSLYNKNRILCICKVLMELIQKYPIESKGVLKRFSTDCYGEQHGLVYSRALKERIKKTVKNKCSKKYQTFWLNYKPGKKNSCDKKRKTIKK